MSDHTLRTIADAERDLEQQLAQVRDTKRLINGLCKLIGQPSRYTDIDTPESKIGSVTRGDEYYGKPLAQVVRAILEDRQRTGLGPASVNELYTAMVAGGYQFENANEDNSKRGLRISLAKNSQTFHKLPSGKFGLLAWYPAVREPRVRSSVNGVRQSAVGLIEHAEAIVDEVNNETVEALDEFEEESRHARPR